MKVRSVISTIILVSACLIFTVTLIGYINSRFSGKPSDVLGFKPVIIMSGSMEPAIYTNSIAIVRKTKNIEPGDIIMYYKSNNETVIHRYIEDNNDGTIITKGDNNDIKDSLPVCKDKVFGKVICRFNMVAPFVTLIKEKLNYN